MTRFNGAALGGLGLAVLAIRWGARRAAERRTDLHGKVALVTGGARGLGFLVAHELARQGCHVAICSRDRDELERARRELAGAAAPEGGRALALVCDVSDRAQVERLVSDTVAHFGRLDILVNNAGIIQVGAFDALTLADFEQAMSINFWGTVHATLAALPHLRATGDGRLVNVTSIGGKVAVPHLLPYDAAKFAAVGFSEGLGAELAGRGVSVTTVIPGLMRTGSHRFALFHGDEEVDRGWFSLAASLPLLAMSAPRAARRIVRAARRRDPEVVLGLPAKMLRIFKELFPRLALRLLAVSNRLLPSPR